MNSLLLLKFLLACIMVNPISLVILSASLVIIILSPLIQFVANARNPQSDPRIHPSSSDVILNVSWCNTPHVTCHICSSDSCHFRLCDMFFPPLLGFVFRFVFCHYLFESIDSIC